MRRLTPLLLLMVAPACSSRLLDHPPALDLGAPSDALGPDLAFGLAVAPADATVERGAMQVFVASAPVTWSVMEPNGGAIDAGGNYTAPSTMGSFHVIATSRLDPSRSAMATVNVTSRLELVAGTLGGRGNLDGSGAAARLWLPSGLAFAGNRLYIADGRLIRAVETGTGTVSTVAGGPLDGHADGIGAAATFRTATGLTSDGNRQLWVADSPTLRHVDLTTGSVTTLPATLTAPIGVSYSAPDTLWITHRYVLYRLTLSTNALTIALGTVGGSPTCNVANNQFVELGPIADDGAGHLYLSDTSCMKTLRFDIATGTVTDLAPPNVGVAVGFAPAAGGTYIADKTGKLFWYDATAKIATAVGAGWTTPMGGLALDGAKRLYAVGGTSLWTLDTNSAGPATTPSALAGREAVASSIDGIGALANFTHADLLATNGATIFIADPPAGIRRVAAADGTVGPFSPRAAFGVALDGLGHLYGYSNAAVDIIDLMTGTLVTTLPENGLQGALPDGSGGYYRTDAQGLSHVDAAGDVTQLKSPQLITPLDHGLAFDKQFIYFVQTRNTIWKMDLVTQAQTLVAGDGAQQQSGYVDDVGAAARFGWIYQMVLDADGHLYAADHDDGAVRRIDVSTGAVTTLAGGPTTRGVREGLLPSSSLSTPAGVALDGTGTLYISDEHALLRVRGVQ